jgi:hypothetical protein
LTDKPAPLTALAAGALRACSAHFPIFALVALACLAAEAAIYFLLHPKLPNVGDAIFPPILTTIVYVYVAANLSDESHRIAQPWERILERVWAVVVIDFITSLIFAVALSGFAMGSLLNAALGVTVLFMFATMLFADVYAAVEPNVTVLGVVPLAFLRSISLAWQKGNLPRILVILSLWLVFNAIQAALLTLFNHWHIRDAAFWSDAPFALLATIPIAAFTALVYFDCVSRERLSSDKRDR